MKNPKIWKDKYGYKIPTSEMSLSHIKNSLVMFIKKRTQMARYTNYWPEHEREDIVFRIYQLQTELAERNLTLDILND